MSITYFRRTTNFDNDNNHDCFWLERDSIASDNLLKRPGLCLEADQNQGEKTNIEGIFIRKYSIKVPTTESPAGGGGRLRQWRGRGRR